MSFDDLPPDLQALLAQPPVLALVAALALALAAFVHRGRSLARARDALAGLRQSLALEIERARRGAEAEAEAQRLRAAREDELRARAAAEAAYEARLAGQRSRIEAQDHALGERDEVLTLREAEIARLRDRHEAEMRLRGEAEARLQAQAASQQARIEELERIRAELEQKFGQMAGSALQANAERFLQLVSERYVKHDAEAQARLDHQQTGFREMLGGLTERLTAFDSRIGEIEKARNEAYGSIVQQVRSLGEGQRSLGQETRRLVQALRAPKTRGRWGEMQLRKVFELAGMTEHVDFVTERTVEGEGGRLRPDAIVSIPGGKSIVVDAKTPLEAYLDALETDNPDDHALQLKRHAGHLRTHVRALAGKAYQDALPTAPDFIVMFIPGETFVAAAAEADPGILEFAFENKVLIASPTTLIALVKAIAYGWQQERMAANAVEVQRLAREIHDRLGIFLTHLSGTGRALGQAVNAYNKAVGSMETRVMPAARRFEALGVVAQDTRLAPVDTVEVEPRRLTIPEALAGDPADPAEPAIPPRAAPRSEALRTGGPAGVVGGD